MKNFQRITHDKSFPFPPRTEVTVQCSSPSTRAQGSTLAWRRRGVRERAFGWVAIDKGYPTRRTRPLDERGKSKSVVEGCEQKQKRIKWTWENWTVRGRANQYFSRKKRRKKRKKKTTRPTTEKPRVKSLDRMTGYEVVVEAAEHKDSFLISVPRRHTCSGRVASISHSMAHRIYLSLFLRKLCWWLHNCPICY